MILEQEVSTKIARIWHGTTHVDKANKYLEVLKETGVPDPRKTSGNLGTYILRRVEDGIAHFITLSFWDSFEAIESFAGEDYDKAKYYPQDSDFLLASEPKAEHYELFGEVERRRRIEKFLELRRGLPRWW